MMEAVAEGLWSLADSWERAGGVAEAIKCLEAICQSPVSFLPITDVKTRLRLAALLMRSTDNITHAKSHLERAQLLLKQLPACFELQCRAYSLLSRCYQLLGIIPSLKQTLKKGLELTTSAGKGRVFQLWSCNFYLQLASALTTEGDHRTALQVLESGLQCCEEIYCPDLQLVFSISILQVYLMQWEDAVIIERAISRCESFWTIISAGTDRGDFLAKHVYKGLFVYKQILQTVYCLRLCNYKAATVHCDSLYKLMDGEVTQPMTKEQCLEQLLQEQLKQLEQQGMQGMFDEHGRAELIARYHNVQQQLRDFRKRRQSTAKDGRYDAESFEPGNLLLGPEPLNEEWLPQGAVVVLIDLLKALCIRPKGMFKDCFGNIDRGLVRIKEELEKLGVADITFEADLQHWAIWIVGVYLVLWIQLLENKVIISLTQTDYAGGQMALLEILDVYRRFPTMLQGCESCIHMLLGHYAQSTGCFHEGALHFEEASKLTESKGMQALSQVNAGLSYLCLGDYSQALDWIGPVYRTMDSYIGVREKTSVLFASGVLQLNHDNLQEARTRLAAGLTLTHKQLGNHQLLSQYLTVLGGIALAMNDTGQARDILKSSFTLAKALHDLPTQVGVLTEMTALWRVLGETDKEIENTEYGFRKSEELRTRIESAQSAEHHGFLLEFGLS